MAKCENCKSCLRKGHREGLTYYLVCTVCLSIFEVKRDVRPSLILLEDEEIRQKILSSIDTKVIE